MQQYKVAQLCAQELARLKKCTDPKDSDIARIRLQEATAVAVGAFGPSRGIQSREGKHRGRMNDDSRASSKASRGGSISHFLAHPVLKVGLSERFQGKIVNL